MAARGAPPAGLNPETVSNADPIAVAGADWVAPPLPEDVCAVEEESEAACPWLTEYVAFAASESPRSHGAFHTAVAVWLLATVAARRVCVDFGGERATPFHVLLVAPSTGFAKTTAVKIGLGLLRAARLDFLLAPDDSTPQALIKGMTLGDTYDLAGLDQDGRAKLEQRVAFAAQKGWFYEEFGGHLRRMTRADSAYADFHGMLRKLYDCPANYRYATVSRGEDHVDRPYLALLGNLTPTDLAPFSGRHDAMWSDGFWARFGFVAVPPGLATSRARFPITPRVWPPSLVESLQEWHVRLGVPSVIFDVADGDEDVTGARAVVDAPSLQVVALPPRVVDCFYAYEGALADIREADGWDAALDANYGRLPHKALSMSMLFASLGGRDAVTHADWGLAQHVVEGRRRGLRVVYADGQLSRASRTKPRADGRLADGIAQALDELQGDHIATQDLLPVLTRGSGSRKWKASGLAAALRSEGIAPERFGGRDGRRRGYRRDDLVRVAGVDPSNPSNPSNLAPPSGRAASSDAGPVPRLSRPVPAAGGNGTSRRRAAATCPAPVHVGSLITTDLHGPRDGSDGLGGLDGLVADAKSVGVRVARGRDGEETKREAMELLVRLLPPGEEMSNVEVFARARAEGITKDALFRAHEHAGVTVLGTRWSGRRDERV